MLNGHFSLQQPHCRGWAAITQLTDPLLGGQRSSLPWQECFKAGRVGTSPRNDYGVCAGSAWTFTWHGNVAVLSIVEVWPFPAFNIPRYPIRGDTDRRYENKYIYACTYTCTPVLLFWYCVVCRERKLWGDWLLLGNSASVIPRTVNHCCFARVQEVSLVKEMQAQVKDMNFNLI